jgi:hypothetical protein
VLGYGSFCRINKFSAQHSQNNTKMSTSIHDFMGSFIATSKLIAGLTAAGISTALGGNPSLGDFGERLVEIGAPTVVGCTIGMWLASKGLGFVEKKVDPDSMTTLAVDGIVAGAATAGLLMVAGFLPKDLSMQTIQVAAVSGGSCVVGKVLSGMLHKK